MRIFTEVIGKIDPLYYDKFVNLEKCCEFFNLLIAIRFDILKNINLI